MSGCPYASRRGFLGAAGGLVAAGGAGIGLAGATGAAPSHSAAPASSAPASLPFFGPHQGGIATPSQSHTFLAALDVTTASRAELIRLLQDWTQAAARMTAGGTAAPLEADLSKPAADSGEVLGLPPCGLTLTFGFGAGLFSQAGRDRFGLAARRPAALVDLPSFPGDQLQPARTGGDLSIQACADDPQVAFHAVRQLVRLAYGRATMRWAQAGFSAAPPHGQTPRNLLGFRDGTENPGLARPVEVLAGSRTHPATLDQAVWVGQEGPVWMRGGSYVVVRRIRLALEHWDRTAVDFQEQVIGRRKISGAPLGAHGEFDALDLDTAGPDGDPVIAEGAHVRLASAGQNAGAQMLRRGYSYNDGVSFTAERWPPWHQGMEYDAGLLFVAYQRDPRTGFIPVFQKLSRLDMLNQYATHTGGGMFAVPGGVAPGGFLGESLFT